MPLTASYFIYLFFVLCFRREGEPDAHDWCAGGLPQLGTGLRQRGKLWSFTLLYPIRKLAVVASRCGIVLLTVLAQRKWFECAHASARRTKAPRYFHAISRCPVHLRVEAAFPPTTKGLWWMTVIQLEDVCTVSVLPPVRCVRLSDY